MVALDQFYPAMVEMTLEEFEEIMNWAMHNAHFSFVIQQGKTMQAYFIQLTHHQKMNMMAGMPQLMQTWLMRRGAEKWLKEE